MSTDTSTLRSDVRYEPDDKPPKLLIAGLGLQLAILTIAWSVIIPVIIVKAAGGSETYMMWAVFASVAISGISTILQAVRVGRIGAGYILFVGTSGAFIAICITAIAQGGPAMLATLVIISSLFQFALARRFSLFRRILTPTVTGTVVMLISVTVMPIIFDLLDNVQDAAHPQAAPVSALVTVLVITAIALKGTGVFRLWAFVAGVIIGSIVGGFFGIYDTARISEAAWIGFPQGGWPGLDLSFGPTFWTLLPGFTFVTLISAIETVGNSVAIQRTSWRRPRAVDFRSVQGAVAVDGVGNLLSGFAGTIPIKTYSTSVSVTEFTGVGTRTVGTAAGTVFLVLACFPKALAAILAIPSPVAAGYLAILVAMLFVVGMRVVVQDGIDYRKGMIAGVSFWVGVGFQNGVIFPEYFAEFAGGLLQNGMTAGGLTALLLTLFIEVTEPRRRRVELPFHITTLPKIREFLRSFASHSGWGGGEAMADRLDAASEETLLTLLERKTTSDEKEPLRRLRIIAHREGDEAVLEFVASATKENLEDQIALLGERATEAPIEQEVSLRMLRHIASSVQHQQYYDTDIVKIRVKAPAPSSD